jgi:hypothetical protein
MSCGESVGLVVSSRQHCPEAVYGVAAPNKPLELTPLRFERDRADFGG